VNYVFSKRRVAMGLFSLAVTLALVLGYSITAFAQAETGRIDGTVTDPSGAVVPKAAVTTRNINTGALRTTESGSDGNYAISNLLPGTYAVTVEAQGFAKQEKRVEVSVGSRHVMNFQLALTGATVVVEVEAAGGVAVNTETQTLSQVISPEEVIGLPTLTRNPYDFAANVGTASDADPSGRGVGVAFNGLRSAGTNVLLDGAANNNEFTATVGQRVPLDSVQEFSVLTNNFTAEYGRASSAVVNLATKSGTNDYHGSVYEYNRVAALASNNFLNNAEQLPRPNFTRNQFGYAIGGPIIKDKLFFFQNTEWIRVRSSATVTTYIVDPSFVTLATGTGGATQTFFSQFGTLRSGTSVVGPPVLAGPPSLMKTGNPPVVGGPIGTGGSTVCGAFNDTAPCSNLSPTQPVFDKIAYTVPSDAGAGNPQNYYNVVGRVDYNYSSKTQAYTRYALYKGTFLPGVVANSPYVGFDSGQTETDNSTLTSLTHTFSPRFTSQTKFVYNRLDIFQPLGATPAVPGLYWSPVNGGFLNGTQLSMPGYLPFTPGNGIPFGGPQNFAQVYQDFGFAKGSHNVRFGGSYQYLQDNRTFGAYETPVSSFGTGGTALSNTIINRFLNGQLGQFQSAIFPQGNFPCPFAAAPRTLMGGAANPNAGQCVDPSTTAGNTTPGNVDTQGNVMLPVSQPNFSRSNRYHEFAAYIQDSWKINSRLTVNGGVRWEYFGIQHNVNPNLDSNYYLAGGTEFNGIRNGNLATVPTSPIDALWRKTWGNFGPRLGVAWDIFGNGKTVFRGGYGITYERNFGNVTFNVIQNPPNYAVISLQNGVDVPPCTSFNPPTPAGCGIAVTTNVSGPLAGTTPPAKALPKTSLRAVNPNIGTSYAHLYSMTLERQVARNFLFGIDYSGSRGEKLYDIANVNRVGSGQIYAGDTCPAYPCTLAQLTRLRATQYSNINFRSDGGISKYNALVVRANMRNFANTGVTLDANYTYAHAFDELSDTFSASTNQFNLGYLDPFNPRVDLGNAYFDLRHRFTLQAVWDVPFFKHETGWKKQVLDGWTIAPIFLAETGSPFTISDCTFGFTVCMRAQTAPGQHIPKSGSGSPSAVTVGGSCPSGPTGNTAPCDQFNYLPLSNNPNNPTTFFYLNAPGQPAGYVNPIVGISDFGPFPANMLPRNQQYGPGYWNVNLGIYKTFFLTERFKLQFRTELYNAFNHANMFLNNGATDVSGAISSVTSSRAAINGNTSASVVNNPIRNIQLALRLTF